MSVGLITNSCCLRHWNTLSVAQKSFFHGLLVWICLFIPVLSVSFVSHSLNLFPTTLTQKNEKKTRCIIFSFWAWVTYQASKQNVLLFPSRVQRIVLRTEPEALLILTCLFPQAYWFSNKVLLSVWSLGEVPVICILSWTRTFAAVICVLFPAAQQRQWECSDISVCLHRCLCKSFWTLYFSSSCWFIMPSMTGTAQGASVTGRKM